jgi:hypothetical protein
MYFVDQRVSGRWRSHAIDTKLDATPHLVVN